MIKEGSSSGDGGRFSFLRVRERRRRDVGKRKIRRVGERGREDRRGVSGGSGWEGYEGWAGRS